MSSKYRAEVVAFFTQDGLILCPFCARKETSETEVALAEAGERTATGIFGLNRATLSEFMQTRFKDEGQFYEDIEFYPCEMCGEEIE